MECWEKSNIGIVVPSFRYSNFPTFQILKNITNLLSNQPIRLSGLSLDFARDGEPFGRLRAVSCVEWPAEPKPGVWSACLPAGVDTALR